MKRNLSLLPALAAVTLLAACATDSDQAALEVDEYRAIHRLHAQQPIDAPKPDVLADQNNDGRVTREEAKVSSALTRQFDQVDSNKDGELDRAEFARLEAASAEARAAGRGTEPQAEPVLVGTDHPVLHGEPDPRPREEYPRPRDWAR